MRSWGGPSRWRDEERPGAVRGRTPIRGEAAFQRRKRYATEADREQSSVLNWIRRSVVAFRVVGLPSSLFRPLYGLSEKELAERGVEVKIADEPNAFPCRVS